MYGYTEGSTGYPASGDLGGVVSAKHIHKLVVGPASTFTQTAQNPEFVQTREQGFPTYQASPGYALTNAVITTSGSIDNATIAGSLQNSEIKTGFDYAAYVAGLEGTRAASHIGRLQVNGEPGQQRHLGHFPARQQALQPRDRHRRPGLDHGRRHRQGARHRRHDRPGQHRRRRLRPAPQRPAAGRPMIAVRS